MIPGSNILLTALRVIGSTPVSYFQFAATVTGPTGLDTVTFNAPVTIKQGSVQAVDRAKYERWGLDWEKTYIMWYVPKLAATDIQRNPDNPGDVIEVNGRRWQLIGGTNWFAMDGWLSLLGVDIGPATGATTNA